MPKSNKERTAQTRADLIAAARRLFIEMGFADTPTPDIAEEAGVTRGALYHHFEDKRALFAAVAEQEAEAVAMEIDNASPEGLDVPGMLTRGGEAFIAAMQLPGRTRLLLLDGPAVLGRTGMDEIDARHGARSLREGIAYAVRKGALPAELPVEATTALLSAAFDRAALAIHAGANANEHRRALAMMIGGLFGSD